MPIFELMEMIDPFSKQDCLAARTCFELSTKVKSQIPLTPSIGYLTFPGLIDGNVMPPDSYAGELLADTLRIDPQSRTKEKIVMPDGRDMSGYWIDVTVRVAQWDNLVKEMPHVTDDLSIRLAIIEGLPKASLFLGNDFIDTNFSFEGTTRQLIAKPHVKCRPFSDEEYALIVGAQ